MLRELTNYVKEQEFYINIWKNKINIVNFKKIVILEEEKIVVMSPDSKIVIKGKKISINKLLDDEILITGIFNSIELGE